MELHGQYIILESEFKNRPILLFLAQNYRKRFIQMFF